MKNLLYLLSWPLRSVVIGGAVGFAIGYGLVAWYRSSR